MTHAISGDANAETAAMTGNADGARSDETAIAVMRTAGTAIAAIKSDETANGARSGNRNVGKKSDANVNGARSGGETAIAGMITAGIIGAMMIVETTGAEIDANVEEFGFPVIMSLVS
jgi:hypothetical protein